MTAMCRSLPLELFHPESALGCDLNWSMQHLNSNYREEDVANEVSDEDLLHRSR